MIKIFFLICLYLTTFVHASTTHLQETLLPNEPLLRDNAFEILAVEILYIVNAERTNANPPTAKVLVRQVLRGPPEHKGEFGAIWQAVARPSDLVGQQLRPNWYAEPLTGPEAGTVFLAFAQNAGGNILVLQSDKAYAFTERNRTTALENLAATTERGAKQTLNYWLILCLPLIALGLLGTAMQQKSLTTRAKKYLRLLSQTTCLVAFAIYWHYENNFSSPDALMRTDLLLILPALAMALGIFIFSLRKVS